MEESVELKTNEQTKKLENIQISHPWFININGDPRKLIQPQSFYEEI